MTHVSDSLELIKRQRSHVVVVLSQPKVGLENEFLDWYLGRYRQAVLGLPQVLTVTHYERHEVDIDQGKHPPLPFRYLALYEISVDGAPAAAPILERIATLHRSQPAATVPATWLYYPLSEKVGRSPAQCPSMLTLAFANPVVGQEVEFREWYATRHIRHALNIPALVSGQCLERTLFQSPGALQARFQIIAVYEQEGTPESIIESFDTLPDGTFNFPMLDLDPARFSEWCYRPVRDVATHVAQ